MAAYLVAMLEVTNPEGYNVYKELVPASLAKYGGEYLVRGGRHEVLEGHIDANRMVVVRFESMEKAKEWWTSPEYEAAKPHRRRSSTGNMVIVEGV